MEKSRDVSNEVGPLMEHLDQIIKDEASSLSKDDKETIKDILGNINEDVNFKKYLDTLRDYQPRKIPTLEEIIEILDGYEEIIDKKNISKQKNDKLPIKKDDNNKGGKPKGM